MTNTSLSTGEPVSQNKLWRDSVAIVFDRVDFGFDDSNVFQNLSFRIYKGEKVGIIGQSGAGKSTIANLIRGDLLPRSGNIFIDEKRLDADESILRYARARVGYLSQRLNNMLQFLSVLENVIRPLTLQGYPKEEAKIHASEALKSVGLDDPDLWRKKPSQISGGELQRATIAKFKVSKRSVLVCDEPTSALDAENAVRAIDMLLQLNTTTLIITHNPMLLARKVDRLFLLYQGALQDVSAALSNPDILQSYRCEQDLLDRIGRLRDTENRLKKKEDRSGQRTSTSKNNKNKPRGC